MDKRKFQDGDIIIGNEKSRQYRITTSKHDWVGVVLGWEDDERIYVVTFHTDEESLKDDWYGDPYIVGAECFDATGLYLDELQVDGEPMPLGFLSEQEDPDDEDRQWGFRMVDSWGEYTGEDVVWGNPCEAMYRMYQSLLDRRRSTDE